jgi:hypothetical protein
MFRWGNEMKILVWLFVIASLSVLLLSACAKANSDEISVTANTTFNLPVGKTAVLKGENISIKFDSVTADSRCPTGVTCIWAGEAKCKILVTQNGQNQEIVLTQSGSSEGSVRNFIGRYQVSFQLSPYPKSGSQIKPQDYVLSLKLF